MHTFATAHITAHMDGQPGQNLRTDHPPTVKLKTLEISHFLLFVLAHFFHYFKKLEPQVFSNNIGFPLG